MQTKTKYQTSPDIFVIREKIVRVIKPTNDDIKTNTTTRAEVRVTVMVAVITAASILCFVPYYISVLLVKINFSGMVL